MAQCSGQTKSGDRCKRDAQEDLPFCTIHAPGAEEVAADPETDAEDAAEEAAWAEEEAEYAEAEAEAEGEAPAKVGANRGERGANVPRGSRAPDPARSGRGLRAGE